MAKGWQHWATGAAASAALVLLGWQVMGERVMVTLPGLLMDWRNPIGPNRPVTWEAGPVQPLATGGPPNIILIVADDLGFNDISLHGAGLVPTPSIDRIGREGVQFTQTYAGSATCAPSRAAIMTGRFPTRIGYEFTPTPPIMAPIVRYLDARRSTGRPFLFHDLPGPVPDFFRMALPAAEVTLPEVLAEGGYHTLHIGKWHLGQGAGTDPLGQGFDESLDLAGLLHAVPGTPGIVDAPQEFDPMDRVFFGSGRAAVSHQGSARFEPVGHLTEYFTDAALDAISANANRPFFLHLSYWAPHAPLQALQSDYDALPHIADHPTRVYAAMLRGLDRNVGRILERLEESRLDRQTLVIFTSDNGGAHTIGLPGINAPFRGWKATFFEGGLRVPLLARWPGTLPPGQVIEGRVHHTDILPTLASAAGLPAPQTALDGHDLMPAMLESRPVAPRTLFFRSGHYEAVIHDGWKLQRMARPRQVFLFHLDTDPLEAQNLADAEPERVAQLSALLDAEAEGLPMPLWLASVEMPVGIDHPLGFPDSAGEAFVYWPN